MEYLTFGIQDVVFSKFGFLSAVVLCLSMFLVYLTHVRSFNGVYLLTFLAWLFCSMIFIIVSAYNNFAITLISVFLGYIFYRLNEYDKNFSQ